jgi:hypothetical protein
MRAPDGQPGPSPTILSSTSAQRPELLVPGSVQLRLCLPSKQKRCRFDFGVRLWAGMGSAGLTRRGDHDSGEREQVTHRVVVERIGRVGTA